MKTIRFSSPIYVGDPVNAVSIFNESEVDEVLIVDIGASRGEYPIDFSQLARISESAFMPTCFGGGLRSVEDVARVIGMGFEKVLIGTRSNNLTLFEQIAREFGRQTLVASIDIKDAVSPKWVSTGTTKAWSSDDVLDLIDRIIDAGAGEILLTSLERDGTGLGADSHILDMASAEKRVPVIYRGGVRDFEEAARIVKVRGISGVALGRATTFHSWPDGVLVHFPSRDWIRAMFTESPPDIVGL